MKNRFYKTNFVFVANRYEEWQAGRCISQGTIQTEIIAEVSGDSIHFELDDIGEIRMLKSFDFDIYGEDYCILPDRIQYSYGTSDFNPIVPMVCHIFYSGNTMQYVRFAMTNPDRLVEFYGSLVKLGQPSTGIRSVQKENNGVTAESILKELRSYGMVKADAIMERAVKIYNDNANVTSIDQAKKIIESLKLFVKAYQLDEEEHEEPGSPLKCKILMFIALCNYTIDNINRAYCIAKQGLDAINEAIENSHFTGIPRSMYGEDTIKELMDAIETNRYDEVTDEDDYYEIDPEEIDTTRFEEIVSMHSSQNINDKVDLSPSSREFVSAVLKKYDDMRMQLMIAVINEGNQKAMQVVMMLHEFVCPVFYAWEYWGHGYMSDFWKEDLCLEIYKRFKSKNILEEVRKTHRSILIYFPFRALDNDGSLKEATLAILKKLIEDIENN